MIKFDDYAKATLMERDEIVKRLFREQNYLITFTKNILMNRDGHSEKDALAIIFSKLNGGAGAIKPKSPYQQ